MTQNSHSRNEAGVSEAAKAELILFKRENCAPSRLMVAAAQQLIRGRDGVISLRQIDTQQEPSPTAKHKVSATPTLVLVVAKQVLGRHKGVLTAAELADWIEEKLLPGDHSPS